MKRLLYPILLLAALPLSLTAQNTDGCAAELRLLDAEATEEAAFVRLRVLAQGPTCEPVSLRAKDLQLTELIAGDVVRTIAPAAITEAVEYEATDLSEERVDVLFLVDASAHGQPAASSEMIRSFLDRGEYFRDNAKATFRLRTFAEALSEPVSLKPADTDGALARLAAQEPAGRAGLHDAVLQALAGLDAEREKQLVFLFASGVNEERDYGDAPRLPARPGDVLEAVSRRGEGLYLFTVSVSGQGGLLSRLPAATPATGDGYAAGTLPAGVRNIFGGDRHLAATHVIDVTTVDPNFSGRERTYGIAYADRPDEAASTWTGRFGSFTRRFTIGTPRTSLSWLWPLILGVSVLAGLLLGFGYALPLIRRRQFERRYVVPYTPRPGRQVLDPITRDPITEGTPVVNVCQMVVPLESWKDCGGQCPHYSGCMSNTLQCDGAGRGETRKFFSLHGINRRLNWVWFGACGGVLGFGLYVLAATFGAGTIDRLATALDGFGGSADTLVRDALLGACFGLGLTFTLAWMEERVQSRRRSWGRILGRATLGGLWSLLVFGGGYLLLDSGILARPLVASALSWVLFGVGLGVILSVRSSIDMQRGLIGGLAAGVIGFTIYLLTTEFLGTADFAKVLSLLVAGGLLGLVLDTVVKLSEAYEMEYVSPENYRRNVPLSKWLKSDWDILIGSQPGSQVYVKWPDEEVLPEHAVMKMEDGRVFLFPHGETLINGRIINGNKRTQLASGDMIQLGRRGNTTMRFWEK